MHDWTNRGTYVHPSELHTNQIIRMLQGMYAKGITKLSCLTDPELDKHSYRIEMIEAEFEKRTDINEYL